jgi:Uma2 family endonuclease
MTRTALRMENEDFLRWAEGRPGRYELVRGQVVEMMVGTTRAHGTVVLRVARLLADELDESRWSVATEGLAVEIAPGQIRYPDVLVEPAGGDPKGLAARTPALVVEVLSDSTAQIDLGDKAAEYLSLSSVEDYLVLAQDGPKGWLFRKGAGPAPKALTGRDVVVELTGLGAKLAFERVYRGFPDWVEPEDERILRR